MKKKIKPTLNGKNLQVARKLLFDIVDLFEKHSIAYHLEGGTLLGIVRDNDLIPWDFDVDISIPQSEVEKLAKLRFELIRLGYKFTRRKSSFSFGPIKKGEYSIFKVKPIMRYIGHMIYPKFLQNLIVLDVFVKVTDSTSTYWQAQGKVMKVDKKYYESYEEVSYRGKQLRVPNHYRDYLTEKYGDWSVVVKEWRCGDDEKTICN